MTQEETGYENETWGAEKVNDTTKQDKRIFLFLNIVSLCFIGWYICSYIRHVS